ncbi:putative phosphoglycerate mutase [Podospora australis]|uniref:Phosphoglycerate mutase n=1 Tax=Podospora australis TaxID=1536484 RepID=A0AAN6WQF8_9PEZI|nr:putative phosphoglycerate mutase [Podospora australis]
MRLFLVRHGETVDNVAGVYAGTRDSPLTAHGVLQAKRLATDFATKKRLRVTHIFSSDLKRAVDTAIAVVDELKGGDAPELKAKRLDLVQLPELRERDFRSGEGKKFGYVQTDAETPGEMRVRAGKFLEGWLLPILDGDGQEEAEGEEAVVVVAHGLILGSLWRVLLSRFGGSGLAGRPGVGEGHVAWSNTGYLELLVTAERDTSASPDVSDRAVAGDVGDDTLGGVGASARVVSPSLLSSGCPTSAMLGVSDRIVSERVISDSATSVVPSGDRKPQQPRYQMTVVGVNVLTHLEGLKKTRGGIGSARFDKRQRTMDSFFGPPSKKAKGDRG